jgi:D-glycero-alpha-D-manno-heptose-7-phosphate kinase
MIISRSPLRVSLIGGGSDLPSHYKEFGGKVLGFAINKYVYLALHDYFAKGIKLAYSRIEVVKNFENIEHPIFRETLRYLNFREDIEIGSFADVPSNGTGLGSSSAFTCALVKGLAKMKNSELESEEIAKIACEIEINFCKSPIGKQDQWLSALGGFNSLEFKSKEEVNYSRVNIHPNLLSNFSNIFKIYYLGYGRDANEILEHNNVKLIPKNVNLLNQLVGEVENMKRYLEENKVYDIGNLLNESWKIKKALNGFATNDSINSIYEKAMKFGAVGGKVLGAGGGGFILFCIPEEKHEYFTSNFNYLRELSYSISKSGTEIVYFD